MAGPESTVRRLIAEAADAARGTIRAYHGSPHSFTKFDASKIGTGEGEQAFGHGLYFSGAEDVASGYRDALRWRGVDLTDPAMRAAMWVHRRGNADDAALAIQNTIDSSMFGRDSLDSRLNLGALDYLRSGEELPPVPTGHMYEVEIGYPEESLLDLDAPVDGQPAAIREALGHFATAPRHFTLGQEGWTGKNAYMAAAPGGFGDAMQEASRRMYRSGIPGLKYFDGNSRTAGEGTRNYVIFPGGEDRIQILRKYGLLPPLMAPALMEDDQ